MIKVYKVNALARPKERRFKEYAGLVTDDEVWSRITPDGEIFNGKPVGKKWKKQKFYYNHPLAPKPNFLWLGAGVFVCDEIAREIAAEPLEMSGEFLPIQVEGETRKYWIYNVTNSIQVLDAQHSKWERLGPKPTDRILERPAFISSRFGEECIFKIPEDRGASMYCAEFTGDPDDGEFKAVVESHGLTGLVFDLIWSGK